MKISTYAKALIAGLGPVLLAAQAAVTDGQITTAEWVTIGTAALVALGVVAVPNRPKLKPKESVGNGGQRSVSGPPPITPEEPSPPPR